VGSWSEWLDRRQREADAIQAEAQRRLDESETAKALAGQVGLEVGSKLGLLRGAAHAVEGTAKGISFIGRLTNLQDVVRNGEASAAGEVLAAGGRALDYGRRVAADRQIALRNAASLLQRLHTDLNPQATTAADTFADEARRNLRVGLNQGELTFDIVSAPIGGAELKALRGLGALSKAEKAGEYMQLGFIRPAAEYLAEPYPDPGHHAFRKLPKKVLGIPLPPRIAKRPLPKAFVESELNIVNGRGMTRGDFYRLHSRVDKHYGGGKLPARVGGQRWSAKELGWTKFGPVARTWYGTPTASKVLAGGAAAGGAAAAADAWERGRRR
jgi:hypothetical protein